MTSDQHSSPIKTPKQLVVVVVLAFLVPVTLILLVSQLVMSSTKSSRDAKTDESRVLERIQPVGTVLLADASAPAGNLTGVQVFDQVCKTCHGAGIAGAPKVGDKGAWAPRIAQGDKVLFQHAIAGFQGKSGLMPPKGGNGDLADVEVERAVVYMANQSGGSLKEPPAPASTATAQGSSVPAGSVRQVIADYVAQQPIVDMAAVSDGSHLWLEPACRPSVAINATPGAGSPFRRAA